MSDEREARLEKLAALRADGIDPYPTTARRSHTAAQMLEQFDELAGQEITLAGRVMELRDYGKTIFGDIEDGSGRVQIYIRQDAVSEADWRQTRLVDRGDFIEGSGTVFTTKTGEKTLRVKSLALLSKSLRQLPAKGPGGELKLFDTETRYRKRYLDLIANRETEVPIFVARARVLSSMRECLNSRSFIEVETPILQPLYGGATARPFVTHHNTLDRDLYLRIAPELYLKRLIVGGLERVYEVARNFRNEGVDRSHNPEFTMMECYQAYADYQDIMHLVEEMYCYVASQVTGDAAFEYLGTRIDLTPPWRRMTLREAIAEYTDIDYEEYPEREALAVVMREHGYRIDPTLGRGRLIDELKDSIVKGDAARMKEPLFLYDYPRDISPLAKPKPGADRIAERFQAFAGGLELGNAFTELNDPLEQRARFEDQARQRAAGDDEAQILDEDYIEALEYGMPPTGGWGGGIDRLVMLLTNQDSIREVILFPGLREQSTG
jgi:lysyl-tRNA synthetase, class II